MHVVISIAEHEIQMGHRWFDWVCELGGTEGHNLHLIPAAGVDISALAIKANTSFHGNVSIIKDEEGQTSDWQIPDFLRSAGGPNSAFRQVAWHFHNNNLGPYFWCELDCIPLRTDWLHWLEREYEVTALPNGKMFMGADVQIESVPPHMSGNGVYLDPVMNAPSLVRRTNWIPKGQDKAFELAFDIAGAREVLQKCHFTTLIQHKFRFKGFESRYEFDVVIDENAVVFHSDKKGTIYKYLRDNLSGIVVGADTKAERKTESTAEGLGSTNLAPDVHRVVQPAQNICGGVGEVKDGGPVAEPVPLQSSRTITIDDELEAVIAQNAVIKNGLPAMSPPWENREDSERDVKMLCDALSLFCKAPIYKSRVRNALREAKIIK